MTNASELCPTCSKGDLRPTAEAATAGESTESVGEISDIHIYACDNCGHREPKAVLKEYIPVSDSVTAKIIKTDESKE
jgi:hypothetical protein